MIRQNEMRFWIQHNEINKTHPLWFLPQKKKVFLHASESPYDPFYVCQCSANYSVYETFLRLKYWGADKSLARLGRKQCYSDRRFWCSYILFIIIIGGILVLFMYITRLTSKEIFSPSNKIHREVGRARDLSAPLISRTRQPCFWALN